MESMPEQRPEHVGDALDPEHMRENEDQEDEGMEESREHAARDPDLIGDERSTVPDRTIFRRIDISNKDEMLRSVRMLDPDQRQVFDTVIRYIKQLRSSWKSGSSPPKPPLLKVHGGAGCGKSKVINDIA